MVIAEDQRLISHMLTLLVEAQPDMTLLGVAGDGAAAVALCREQEPDVVLMDVAMPVMDGVSATRKLKKVSPGSRILILTSYEDDRHVFEGIRAGAFGYLNKNCSPEELAEAIRAVHAGETIASSGIAREMLDTFENGGERRTRADAPTPPESLPLTAREREVVTALARGESNREISCSLYISENTVRNHIANIYKKLHINDRAQAALYAVRRGMVDTAGTGQE